MASVSQQDRGKGEQFIGTQEKDNQEIRQSGHPHQYLIKNKLSLNHTATLSVHAVVWTAYSDWAFCKRYSRKLDYGEADNKVEAQF